ncbi:hypothetical protein SDC9_207203 [bioreactor metagenome]|uniref:Uncharacterized protein n=1 Tax=bioreactor metagenome TaxID=1076179 RepID=A0A645J8M8_9ZZZZ
MYLQLQIHEIRHVFLQVVMVDLHHLFQRLAILVFDDQRPLPVDLGHFLQLWYI